MKQRLSIVVPAYNEEQVLAEFNRRLSQVLDSLDMEADVIYVNDGSQDGTLNVLSELRSRDPRVAIVDLSRNFGKEIALLAGLDHADGDAVIIIDADLQDPPELIPEMVAEWRKDYDVVYARRAERAGESALKKTTAYLFYRIMHRVGEVELPEDVGDFRLLSRRATEALKKIRERHRFTKGLFAWIGFRQKAISYRRDARYAGKTKWNYLRLWSLAMEGITSFTTAPLKIATYLGVVFAGVSFLYGLFIILDKVISGNPVPGYPSLMAVVLFFGGLQLVFLGLIGEYLGRIFNETKNRPLYFVNEYLPPAHCQTNSSADEM